MSSDSDSRDTDDDELTPIECLACRGLYRVHMANDVRDIVVATCSWCDQGRMTEQQRKLWSFMLTRRRRR